MKYFPPDYDPSKIPRRPKGYKNRTFNLRTMAPFNMRCTTCKEYIYKARKFNSRVSEAEETYLKLKQFRFVIRCTKCSSEIIWRSDIESNDYVLESGATRNFEALRTAEKLEQEKTKELEEELANDPMKALEQRTAQSRNDMDIMEALQDLKDLNQVQAGFQLNEKLLDTHSKAVQESEKNEEAEIEDECKQIMTEWKQKQVDEVDSDEEEKRLNKEIKVNHPEQEKQSLFKKMYSLAKAKALEKTLSEGEPPTKCRKSDGFISLRMEPEKNTNTKAVEQLPSQSQNSLGLLYSDSNSGSDE